VVLSSVLIMDCRAQKTLDKFSVVRFGRYHTPLTNPAQNGVTR
jgi:hypothetical protein